ncbi:MAG: hypothetical protein LC798_03140 [Chloroflexi bacterium]|nr:hypothetical protein [Chloroflexota bacterium]
MADDPKPDPTREPAPKPEPDDDGDLGDAGKRAIAEERTARKAAEKAHKAAMAELDKLKASTATDQEKALAAAKEEGRAEALKSANERVLRSEIRAAASTKLADPGDAVRLLDPDDFADEKTGEVDSKRLAKAVDDLLKEKPYLAGKGARPAGDGGNGVRGGAPSGGSFLTEAIRNSRR